MPIPKSNEVNHPSRWGRRIAWLAQQGVNPSDIAKQNEHKAEQAHKVVDAARDMCRNFPKAVE